MKTKHPDIALQKMEEGTPAVQQDPAAEMMEATHSDISLQKLEEAAAVKQEAGDEMSNIAAESKVAELVSSDSEVEAGGGSEMMRLYWQILRGTKY